MTVVVEDIEAPAAQETITCLGVTYRVHPAASEFDLIPEERLESLADDIAKRGLRHAIIRNADGLILDGRNRLHACDRANVDPHFATYGGDDEVAEIVSCNLERRHLNENERARMAVRMLPHYEAQTRELQRGGQGGVLLSAGLHKATEPVDQRRATAKAARDFNVAPRRVAQMKRVNEAAPELADKVVAGEITLNKAETIVKDRASGLQDSDGDSWFTPTWLFNQLDLAFDMDVCAPRIDDHRTAPARIYYTETDDGLAQEWKGLIWCNPPYSKPEQWTDRMVEHGHGLLLVHMPNNAAWAVRAQRAAAAVRLIQSMHFLRPNGQTNRPGYSLQLLAYGDTAAAALKSVEGDMVGPLWVPA